MSEVLSTLRGLTDEAVVACVDDCVGRERVATSRLIASLSELDVRRLYLPQGYSSLFDYCIRRLHMSERSACSRIAAARLARRFPMILELIADARVSLTAVACLARHLTEANHSAVLLEATHKTVREVEEIVARLNPQPDARALVRRVAGRAGTAPESATPLIATATPAIGHGVPAPARAPAPNEAATGPVQTHLPPRAILKPLAPGRYKVQFTVSGETRAKLRVVQDLLRHSVPDGDIGAVFDRALSALLADLEKRKLALVTRPRKTARPARKGTRLIPAAVRRAVWARDKARCAFVGAEGRCRERGGLELHHVKPFAAGGQASAANIELRCRAHRARGRRVLRRRARALTASRVPHRRLQGGGVVVSARLTT